MNFAQSDPRGIEDSSGLEMDRRNCRKALPRRSLSSDELSSISHGPIQVAIRNKAPEL